MDMDKSIFQNLMSSVLLRLHTTTAQVIRSPGRADSSRVRLKAQTRTPSFTMMKVSVQAKQRTA